LLLPAAKDKELANLPEKRLSERSAEAAGTNHPAVLMLLTPPAGSSAGPAMVHDEAMNLWGAVVPLNLGVKGDATSVTLPVQLILIGMAMI
jgi:hypothetical protein